MSRYSFRSLIFMAFAITASAFFYTSPAAAVPIDPGVYVVHIDAYASQVEFAVLLDRAIVQREAAAFLNGDHGVNSGGNRMPFGLSPEYAESYATDGLSFIDLRRRC